jgi:cytoskeletal protein CcmA (bactofilin family)
MWRRLALAGIVVPLLFAGLMAGKARAVEFRSGDVVVIEEGQVVDDDLFISANRVIVNGTVNGDLWVASGDVQVAGTVNGSIFLAGGVLRIDGDVNGSAYAAGSTAIVGPRARVERNLYFAGFGLRMVPGSAVGQDVLATGNQAVIRGQVGRNLSFGGVALEIDGTVGNDVNASVSEPGGRTVQPPFAGAGVVVIPAGIHVSESARIGGQLTYTSPVEQPQNIRSQPGRGVVFRPAQAAPVTAPAPSPAVSWLLGWVRLFLTLLGLGALALYGLGASLPTLAEKAMIVPLLSVGWGILIILAGFTAALVAGFLVLAVTGVLAAAVFFGAGTTWAFGFTIFLLAVVFGSRIVVSYLLGRLVLVRLAGQRNPLPIYVLLVGVAIYSLVQSIPFVGAVAGAIATVLGFGAIYLVWRDSEAAPRIRS